MIGAFLLAVLVLPVGKTFADSPNEIPLSHCVVSLIKEAQIPTGKPGVIVRYLVKEGMFVKAGDEIAHIDNAEVQAQLVVAQRQLETAERQAANDIDVRYAKAAALVAKSESLAAKEANRRVPGTVPLSEVRRLELAENRAVLGVEQAEEQFALAGIETGVAEAQLDAAKLEIDRRRITSPIDGIVVRLHHHVGEWVDAGQPICHVVGLDRLRVTGFVNVRDYEQDEVTGRKAVVTVRLANGDKEDFNGVINFASPIVQPGGEFRVWTEVENRQRKGKEFWIMRPGLPDKSVKMSIHLK